VKGVFWIACAGLFWALDTLLRYPMLGQFSPSVIVFWEHALLALIFVPLAYFFAPKTKRTITIGDLACFFFIGAGGSALATLSFTYAFSVMNPSVVILLQKWQPLVALLLARLFLKETLSKSFFISVALCLLGSWFLSFPSGVLPSNLELRELTWQGLGATFLSVFFWGGSTVFGKGLSGKFHTLEILSGRFMCGLFAMSAIILSTSPGLFSLVQHESFFWKNISGMVLLSGCLGMYFYYRGLKLIPAKWATLSELFFPVFAVALNWLFLGQTFEVGHFVGAALVLLGTSLHKRGQA
jgi:drug/metabolite transporter (DMT)-like permease